MELYTVYMLLTQMEKGKKEAQSIFLDPLTISSSSKRKFVVCLFGAKKQTEVICLQTDCTE